MQLDPLQMMGMTGDVLGNQDGSGQPPLNLSAKNDTRSGGVNARGGNTGAFTVVGGGEGGSMVPWAVAGIAIGLILAWSRKRKR